jgi:uncharacterized protein
VLFEWNPGKAGSNLSRHGVGFPEAASVFFDPLAITYPDPDHSEGEFRLITFGSSTSGRLLVVAHVEVDHEHLRIISARRATRREADAYQEQI